MVWMPKGYTYNEFSVFGIKTSLDLQDGLLLSNPKLEREGALYAVLCILAANLKVLPVNAIPLDEAGRDSLTRSVVESFGREKSFGYVRAGRTIVLMVRTEGAGGPESEEEFLSELEAAAINFHYSVEDNIGYPISISISPIFDSFNYCEQVACEALTAADFVRFVEMPTPVVSSNYCASIKQIIGKRYPDHRIKNYERPIISAMLNENLAQAERIVNDFLTAHLMDPLYVFPSIRSNMVNIMRICQSMCCMDPWAFATEVPKIPHLQKAMSVCPVADTMRALIHEYFEHLDSYVRQNRDTEAQNERMNKILKYIYANVSNPLLGAPMVCDEFGMSTTYFSRIFKEDTGVNFSVFLQTLRITKAKNLLLETNMTLNAIAQEVGYISSQNLLRLFKRYEGMSPSAYRQMAGRTYAPEVEAKN